MPSKKRKYNARFPAGRIKKIMQTDEEVGKVAQAVPIIIYPFGYIPRTLELFVESLLSKAMQVTLSRNAKTLSPSHVKMCILAESRFDFLKDLVKGIPDVCAAEEKELMSAENSPNSSRFSDTSGPPRKILREDSSSSSSSDVKNQATQTTKQSLDDLPKLIPILKFENLPTPAISSPPIAIDLTKKLPDDQKLATPNFYQETLILPSATAGVIKLNPTYTISQPSTSTSIQTQSELPINNLHLPTQLPKSVKPPVFHLNLSSNNINAVPQVTPLINIDFSKNLSQPEIRVIETPSLVPIASDVNSHLQRQLSKSKIDVKRVETKVTQFDVDNSNSGSLEIDEDYDT